MVFNIQGKVFENVYHPETKTYWLQEVGHPENVIGSSEGGTYRSQSGQKITQKQAQESGIIDKPDIKTVPSGWQGDVSPKKDAPVGVEALKQAELRKQPLPPSQPTRTDPKGVSQFERVSGAMGLTGSATKTAQIKSILEGQASFAPGQIERGIKIVSYSDTSYKPPTSIIQLGNVEYVSKTEAERRAKSTSLSQFIPTPDLQKGKVVTPTGLKFYPSQEGSIAARQAKYDAYKKRTESLYTYNIAKDLFGISERAQERVKPYVGEGFLGGVAVAGTGLPAFGGQLLLGGEYIARNPSKFPTALKTGFPIFAGQMKQEIEERPSFFVGSLVGMAVGGKFISKIPTPKYRAMFGAPKGVAITEPVFPAKPPSIPLYRQMFGAPKGVDIRSPLYPEVPSQPPLYRQMFGAKKGMPLDAPAPKLIPTSILPTKEELFGSKLGRKAIQTKPIIEVTPIQVRPLYTKKPYVIKQLKGTYSAKPLTLEERYGGLGMFGHDVQKTVLRRGTPQKLQTMKPTVAEEGIVVDWSKVVGIQGRINPYAAVRVSASMPSQRYVSKQLNPFAEISAITGYKTAAKPSLTRTQMKTRLDLKYGATKLKQSTPLFIIPVLSQKQRQKLQLQPKQNQKTLLSLKPIQKQVPVVKSVSILKFDYPQTQVQTSVQIQKQAQVQTPAIIQIQVPKQIQKQQQKQILKPRLIQIPKTPKRPEKPKVPKLTISLKPKKKKSTIGKKKTKYKPFTELTGVMLPSQIFGSLKPRVKKTVYKHRKQSKRKRKR